MVVKTGRYGKFAACPNYPGCKNTNPISAKSSQSSDPAQQNTPVPGMKCEKCGADMVLRSGRYGSFYACSNYPECKTTKQIVKKIGVKCPVCGGDIITKRGKNKAFFYSCENYENVDFHPGICPLMKNVRSAVRCCLKRKENLLPYVIIKSAAINVIMRIRQIKTEPKNRLCVC